MVAERLRETEDIDRSVFPMLSCKLLCPPREDLSNVARDVVLELGFNICAKSTALWPIHDCSSGDIGLPGVLRCPVFTNPVSCYGVRWLFPCDVYLFTVARAH